MARSISIAAGWVLAALVLYLLFAGIEVYWNLYTWAPQPDYLGLALVGGALLLVGATYWLARATRDRVSRIFSILACLALAALAVYIAPPEASTPGLFSRDAVSPVWYRFGRLLLLFAPGLFLVLCWRGQAAKPAP